MKKIDEEGVKILEESSHILTDKVLEDIKGIVLINICIYIRLIRRMLLLVVNFYLLQFVLYIKCLNKL